MTDDDLRTAWKEQPMNTNPPTLDQVRAGAERLHRRVARRNALELAACVLVIGVFAYYLWAFPSPLMRLGSGLAIAGTLVVAWQLKRRAANRPLPTALGDQPWLRYRREQLVRQRDALRSAWLWYVAPFIPGVVVFRWGVETQLPPDAPFARGWMANLSIALVFVGVALWNRHAARRLQQHIDRLDEQGR